MDRHSPPSRIDIGHGCVMRLFQLFTFGRPYLHYFDARTTVPRDASHADRLAALLDDRYGNAHILQPVLDRAENACLVVADDERLQRAWADEHGMKRGASLESIVLAQIEEHRAEVLYNLTPVLFDSTFVKRLPSCVRATVCWRAAPSGIADFSRFDLRLSNFESGLAEWRREGYQAAWFDPSHDPISADYARGPREIEVAFVGSFGRLHGQRNTLLNRIAQLAPRYGIQMHLAMARSARLVNWLPLARFGFPQMALLPALRRVSRGEIYGRAMYRLFGNAKIVVNAAINMAEQFRGNMRCWEAMGCGALMLSDEGVYPPGMRAGRDFETYRDHDDAVAKIERILADYDAWRPMAARGLATMETTYSKAAQWATFVELVDKIRESSRAPSQ